MACWPAFFLLLIGASALNLEEDSEVLPGVRLPIPERLPREDILFPDDPRLLPDAPIPGESAPGNALDVPEDWDELPLETLERMNSFTSIDEFLALFELEQPENAPIESATADISIGLSVDSRFGASSTAAVAKRANCKPEQRTVELKLPEEPNTVYYPSCVRLPRCGGCCFGTQLECQPTASKPIKLKVLKTVTSSTSRRSSRRRRRRVPPTYVDIEEQEHTECDCGCKVQESHCIPEVQVYSKKECSCLCKNKEEEVKCEKKNTTHLWDPKKCQCFCRKTQGCSTGQYFSHTSCSCEWPVASRTGVRASDFQPSNDGGLDFPVRRRNTSRRRGSNRGHRRRPERVPIDRRRPRRPERVLIDEPIIF